MGGGRQESLSGSPWEFDNQYLDSTFLRPLFRMSNTMAEGSDWMEGFLLDTGTPVLKWNRPDDILSVESLVYIDPPSRPTRSAGCCLVLHIFNILTILQRSVYVE